MRLPRANLQQSKTQLEIDMQTASTMPRIVNVRSMAKDHVNVSGNNNPRQYHQQFQEASSLTEGKPVGPQRNTMIERPVGTKRNIVSPRMNNQNNTPLSYANMKVNNDVLKDVRHMTLSDTKSVMSLQQTSNVADRVANGVQAVDAALIPEHMLHPNRRVQKQTVGERVLHPGNGVSVNTYDRSRTLPPRVPRRSKPSPPIPVHRVTVPAPGVPIDVPSSETRVQFGGQKYKLQIGADPQGQNMPQHVLAQINELKRSATNDATCDPSKRAKIFLNPLPTSIADAPGRTLSPNSSVRTVSPSPPVSTLPPKQPHAGFDTQNTGAEDLCIKNKTTVTGHCNARVTSQSHITARGMADDQSDESVPMDLTCSRR